ncbi:hypothetical protein RUND412_008608 [Rhizina undulata]
MSNETPDLTTAAGLTSYLSTTSSPAHNITPLSGGFANFTFRGTISAGSEEKTVIIKHAEPFVALAKNISFDPVRCYYESATLKSLSALQVSINAGEVDFTIRLPKVLEYFPETHTIITTDAGPRSETLKAALLTNSLSPELLVPIGTLLGRFLQRLHSYGRTAEAEEIKTVLQGNTQSSHMSLFVTYGRLSETVTMYPRLLPYAEVFSSVLFYMTPLYLSPQSSSTLTHGDFWCGNILLSPSSSIPKEIIVIDWEVAKYGPSFADLGQMCAELFLPFHFHGVEAGREIIKAFLGAYAEGMEVEERRELAWRTAVHFGTHLVVWPPRVQGWGSKERVEEGVSVGAEYVRRGWERDWEWLKGSVLGVLLE